MFFRFAQSAARAGSLFVIAFFVPVLQAETIQMRFAPPAGETQTVVTRSTRTVYRGGEEQVDVGESKYKTTATKKEDGGYRIVKEIASQTMTRNGHNVASPMLDAMAGLELVYSVDRDGQVTAIHGYDGILVNLKSKFPPALMQTLGPLFNERSLRNQDMAAWNAQVSEYAGKTVELGDVWTATETTPLPAGGRAEFQKATVFERWVDCGGGRCLRVRFFYHSEPEKLAEAVAKVTDKPIEPATKEENDKTPSSAEVSGEGERIMDPATLLLYSEKITRTVVAENPQASGKSTQIKVVETREYTSKTGSSE